MKPWFPVPKYEELFSMAMGGSLAAGTNWSQRKPLGSRVWMWGAYIAGGYVVGHLIAKRSREKVIAREVYLHDYVRLHPDDFPELTQTPKKYKEVLEKWHPIR